MNINKNIDQTLYATTDIIMKIRFWICLFIVLHIQLNNTSKSWKPQLQHRTKSKKHLKQNQKHDVQKTVWKYKAGNIRVQTWGS